MNSIKWKEKEKIILLLIFLLFLIFLPLVFRNPARVGMFIACCVASVLTMGWLLILRIGCISLGQVAMQGTSNELLNNPLLRESYLS